jgi:mannuronan 5-epimerase
VKILAIGTALCVGAAASLIAAAPAAAAACTSPVRYAATSNTIYLVAKQSYTLSSIKQACPSAPLSQVDPKTHTWQLNADLVLQNGSTLLVRGSRAGGDVDTLRLRSLASNKPTEVSQLMANPGNIEMNSVRVTSWDTVANGPDKNPSIARAAAGARGRAFIRAISTLTPSGSAQLSTMKITNSDLGYLGYYAAESYGVVYKARGCDRANVAACQKVHVGGSQTNSRFHDNYMGTYAWGAKGMAFRNNSYDHNASYGLDPHDVSTNLTVDRNKFAYNGNHGFVCSQLCDRLSITNNESHHNGLVPWRGPTGDSDLPGQVHGIMIHRGVTNATISGNSVHDQPNGVGIAVFDSAGNTVTGNTVTNNMVGIRLTVGAANNTVRNNTVKNSAQYGLLFFKGTDAPGYTTKTGRPTGNVIDGNTIIGAGRNAVKATDADQNRITNTTFGGSLGPVLFITSSGSVLDASKLPPSVRIQVTGTGSQRSSLSISNPPGCARVTLDAYSTCTTMR